MNFLYPLFLSFTIIFLAELGDKTQIMVLSFSTKSKIKNILLGIALGTFLSHGLAILLGSQLGSINNESFSYYLNLFTYLSFIVFGIVGFISMKRKCSSINVHDKEGSKTGFISKLCKWKINYLFIIAFCILIGELGDKTFLSSIGLGIQYPEYKLSLIVGSILGMVCSNLLAILCGKILSMKFNQNIIEIISNSLFILFGIIGLIFKF